MSSNYYCDLKGIFHVVAMIGDQVDSDFDPEDLMDVQERYGGQLPDSYCMRDPYAQRRMTFRFVTIVTFLTSPKFIITFLLQISHKCLLHFKYGLLIYTFPVQIASFSIFNFKSALIKSSNICFYVCHY
jgi:hypothetical protein